MNDELKAEYNRASQLILAAINATDEFWMALESSEEFHAWDGSSGEVALEQTIENLRIALTCFNRAKTPFGI